jgi:hypothetical protein
MNPRIGSLLLAVLMVAAFAIILYLDGQRRWSEGTDSEVPPEDPLVSNERLNTEQDLRRTLAEAGLPSTTDLAQLTVITVHVLDSNGGGVAGANLSVVSIPDLSATTYRCDTTGKAVLQFTPPVDLTFSVSLSRKLLSGYRAVRVTHGAGQVELSMTPLKPGTVTGRVYQGAASVAAVELTLFHEEIPPMTAISDENGWYRFESVSPGVLELRTGRPFVTTPGNWTLRPSESAIIDFNLPEFGLVMILLEEKSAEVLKGVKLEVEYTSFENDKRTFWNVTTDAEGTTAPLFIQPGKIRWRIRDGGSLSLSGHAGEFEWLPSDMESEVLLIIPRQERRVELLLDETERFGFTPIAQLSNDMERAPQVFLLTDEGVKSWFELSQVQMRSGRQLSFLAPAHLNGTVGVLNDNRSKMLLAVLPQGDTNSVTLQAHAVSIVRLLAMVTREDGILATNFRCIEIVDEQGRQWPTGGFWLNHGRTTSKGSRSVTPEQIAALPPGDYSITIDCLTGRTETKQVHIDGVTATQTVWFSLR